MLNSTYEPSLTAKAKYPIANFVSIHRLSKSYASFVNQLSFVSIPSKVQDALRDAKLSKAMEAEIEALEKNHTWELVPLPRGKQTMGCRWVYTVKHHPNVSIEQYKVRLIAKGYT